jgi:hypothetical protein
VFGSGDWSGSYRRSGRQGWHSTRSGSAWLFSAALWPGSPLYPPRTLQDGGMAGESASALELEPTRAPQEPDSHHALSLRFERYRNILNIFMSYQELSLLVRRTGRRWLLVTWSESLLFWLLFGMAQPIQLALPSPPHSPRGVVTMGIVTARSVYHPPYRRVSKGPDILTEILQKGPKISQKSHRPRGCAVPIGHSRPFCMSLPRRRESRGGTEVNYDAR